MAALPTLSTWQLHQPYLHDSSANLIYIVASPTLSTWQLRQMGALLILCYVKRFLSTPPCLGVMPSPLFLGALLTLSTYVRALPIPSYLRLGVKTTLHFTRALSTSLYIGTLSTLFCKGSSPIPLYSKKGALVKFQRLALEMMNSSYLKDFHYTLPSVAFVFGHSFLDCVSYLFHPERRIRSCFVAN